MYFDPELLSFFIETCTLRNRNRKLLFYILITQLVLLVACIAAFLELRHWMEQYLSLLSIYFFISLVASDRWIAALQNDQTGVWARVRNLLFVMFKVAEVKGKACCKQARHTNYPVNEGVHEESFLSWCPCYTQNFVLKSHANEDRQPLQQYETRKGLTCALIKLKPNHLVGMGVDCSIL